MNRIDSQDLKRVVDLLTSFSEVHLGEAEVISVESHIDCKGVNKLLRIKWWLDYGTARLDDDDDSRYDSRRILWLDQLPERREPTIAQRYEESYEEGYSAGVKLWRDKTKLLRTHLSPEFRLLGGIIDTHFQFWRASVLPGIPPAGSS